MTGSGVGNAPLKIQIRRTSMSDSTLIVGSDSARWQPVLRDRPCIIRTVLEPGPFDLLGRRLMAGAVAVDHVLLGQLTGPVQPSQGQ